MRSKAKKYSISDKGTFLCYGGGDLTVRAPLAGRLINSTLKQDGIVLDQGDCTHYIRVYPSKQFGTTYETRAPIIYTCCVASVFLFTTFMFVFYNWLVERRNTVLLKSANDTNAIVRNIFPKGFRDQILQQDSTIDVNSQDENHWLTNMVGVAPKSGLADFLHGEGPIQVGAYRSKPLAELYPESTILVRTALRSKYETRLANSHFWWCKNEN